MRTSKLLNLGSAVLVLGLGAVAAADQVPPSPVEGVAASEAAEPPPPQAEQTASDVEANSEPELPEAASASEPWAAEAAAPEAVAETVGPEGTVEGASPEAASASAPGSASEPWAAEAAAPEAVAETAGPEGTVEGASPEAGAEVAPPESGPTPTEPEATALGALGYDSQGRPGRIHVVRPGDTLWDISDAYLGTPWVWPSIWQDNQKIENPHLIYPGDRIWITPSEMRRVTSAEAEALLAGAPAALQEETSALPEPGVATPEIEAVPQEQPRHLVSDREMVGLVSAEVVEASASIVSAVPMRLMLGQSDRVWVGLGAEDVELGDQFTVFRTQEKVYDPETGRMLGYHVHFLGWLEILETDSETSLAEIGESTHYIVRGDRLMPRKPVVREIALRASPGDIRGQISFLAKQRTQVGTMEYVYLNRGALDGLEVGSPLEVYRKGYLAREEVSGERVQVPERVVADLLVVKTQPEASVALIRHTEEELELGDYFRGAQR